jgi:hypothetical protein
MRLTKLDFVKIVCVGIVGIDCGRRPVGMKIFEATVEKVANLVEGIRCMVGVGQEKVVGFVYEAS